MEKGSIYIVIAAIGLLAAILTFVRSISAKEKQTENKNVQNHYQNQAIFT